MSNRYYFDNTQLSTKFATIWYGFFSFNGIISVSSELSSISPISILGDLLTSICDINFYVNIDSNNIYISLCSDSHYYASQFEKDISNIVREINSKLKIKIESGEFKAFEQKHNGNQYKYTITFSKTGKINLKKKVLNWDVVEKKKKTDVSEINTLSNDVSNINIV
jgi:hypothetical protein